MVTSNMSDNGILAQVSGIYVSEGIGLLPQPAVAGPGLHSVELDAGHVGRVRIYYKLQTARHRKHSHVFWLAVSAEIVTPPEAT